MKTSSIYRRLVNKYLTWRRLDDQSLLEDIVSEGSDLGKKQAEIAEDVCLSQQRISDINVRIKDKK